MSQYSLTNIDTSFESYQQLISLYNQNRQHSFQIIELSLNQWFAANICAVLGGILDKLQERLNSVSFDYIKPEIRTILQKNDFLSYFGYEKQSDLHGTTIKYLKLKPVDARFFQQYVVDELLNRPELPQMTRLLKKKITESICEIFTNAQIHSETDFIYTCGQFYPAKKIIEFTITDTGIGFKNCINKRFGLNLSAIQTIKWAIQDGHSTKQDISGGIGLAILREFIVNNGGKIQIISDDGFYQLDPGGEQGKSFSGSFPGTIVTTQFRTDDTASYALAGVGEADDIF